MMAGDAQHNLILGAATGYSLEAILPFVVSLKKTGYRGRLCLFVWDLDRQTCSVLERLGAQLYPCSSGRVDKRYTVTGGRFFVFQDFLRDLPDDGRRVLLSDVRDVIFQRDPFEAINEPGMHFFLEEDGYTLGSEPFNAGAMSRAYPEAIREALAPRPISCVGVSMGDIGSMRAYLRGMDRELTAMPEDFFGSDQAAHNRIVYAASGEFPACVHANGTSAVLHMGLMPAASIRWSPEAGVCNACGEVAAVLHQYDRHPELTSRLLKRLL